MIRIVVGDCRASLAAMPSASVHFCMTSIPYYGLRDYGVEPLVWGGDPACSHRFTCEEVEADLEGTRRKRANLAAWSKENGRGGGLKQVEHDAASQGRCRCGAWRGALGLEPDYRMFVAHVVEVFREVRRVLRPDGTCLLNCGDTYASAMTKGNSGYGTSTLTNGGKYQEIAPRPWSARPKAGGTSVKRRGSRSADHAGKHGYALDPKAAALAEQMFQPNRAPQPGMKPKDRMMIPARVAIALQMDEPGWYLRDEIVWHKSNPMPSSVDDRTTPAHEMLYLLSPSARYFWDAEAIKEPASENTNPRGTILLSPKTAPRDEALVKANERFHAATGAVVAKRNKRSVWTIATAPFPEAHFATFPPGLVEPGILAGTSARGCCPTCGAGWERVTAEVETGRVQKMPDGRATYAGGHDAIHRGGREAGRAGNPVVATETIGWHPGCGCYGVDPLPPYPPKPSRAAGRPAEEALGALRDDERAAALAEADALYRAAAAAWREACEPIIEERRRICRRNAGLPAVPAVVLDPFGGAGTVGMVADRLQRDGVLLELNPSYAEIARRRIVGDGGGDPLFRRVTIEGPGEREAAE